MKILFINILYYPNIHGGAERSVQLLAEGLVKKGHKSVVIALGEKYQEYNHNGVQIYVLEYKNIYPLYTKENISYRKFKVPLWHTIDTYNFFIKKDISKIIEIESPDLVHTNAITGFSVSIWDEIKKYKLPIVHTLRNYYLLCLTGILYAKGKICEKQCLKCKIFSYPKKQISNKVDYVVGISNYTLDKHLDSGYFKDAKSKVIFNSIDKINILKKSENIKKDLVFGYIGALHYYKGIELVLNLFSSELKTNKLLIAGKGEDFYEESLKNKYNNKNIEFLGWQNTEDFFTKIDILIVPTLGHEPFGRIIIEAYGNGIPVIGNNKGGIPDIIKEKETGLLFDSENVRTLVDAVNYFKKNKNQLNNYQENCIEYSKSFLNEIILDKYIEIYKELIDEN